jgi:hypothetical protein
MSNNNDEMFCTYIGTKRKFKIIEDGSFIMLRIDYCHIENEYCFSSKYFDFSSIKEAEDAILLIKLAT